MHRQTCAQLLGFLRPGNAAAGLLVRRRWPLIVVLTGAAVLAVASTLLFLGVFSKLGTEVSDSPDSAPILIARSYIPPFAALSPANVEMRKFPRGFIPPGAFNDPSELIGKQKRARFLSAVPIPEGQPVTRALLVEAEKNHGMAALLGAGRTAVSFAVEKVRGAGGWVEPGDSIALYQTQQGTEPRQLFASLYVLAVNQKRLNQTPDPQPQRKQDLFAEMEGMETAGAIITVSLNLAETPVLVKAQDEGGLTAVLRAMGDDLGGEAGGK